MATTKYFLVSSGSGKAKPKHQELMDELLQSLYPVLSLCRGHTTPYQVGGYRVPLALILADLFCQSFFR